jgi:hypothetical protein
MAKKKKKKKKLAIRHRSKSGRFSKRGKKERVYTQATTIMRRIAKRERAQARAIAKKAKEATPPAETAEVFEWVVNFSYEKSGRSFDVIVTARDENEAYNVGLEFLRGDVKSQRIVRSGMRGWMPSVARGKKANEEAGNAVYRNDSDEEA